eukprot:gene11463-23974_t
MMLNIILFLGTTCSISGFLQSSSIRSRTNGMSVGRLGMSTKEMSAIDRVNIPLENVLNVRDIASAFPTLKPGRVYRSGCVSNASETDVTFLHKSLGMQSWIDLRSDKEHEEDEHLNSKVYNGYQSYYYNKKKNSFETAEPVSNGKRFFVSLMSESLIKKGVFERLRKRSKVFAWLPFSLFSRRAYAQMKAVFIKEINDGGLPLLNQLVIKASGAAITSVLKIIASDDNLPVALYCTAGKDRTGLITMLLLDICGVPDHAIIADYEHSDSAYKDINNKRAMVASLAQSDLNPDKFLGAKGYVMAETMNHIRSQFGSVNNFLDKYDFNAEWRSKL